MDSINQSFVQTLMDNFVLCSENSEWLQDAVVLTINGLANSIYKIKFKNQKIIYAQISTILN